MHNAKWVPSPDVFVHKNINCLSVFLTYRHTDIAPTLDIDIRTFFNAKCIIHNAKWVPSPDVLMSFFQDKSYRRGKSDRG